jgi:hypothetical protein
MDEALKRGERQSGLNEPGYIMRDLLKSLAGCQDVASLRSTIYERFTEFGAIAHMDIVTMKQPGKRQALCFLRLESPTQEQRLMANPGVTRFGGELLFVVDLPTRQANSAGQPADSGHDQSCRDDRVERLGHDQSENAGERLWFNPARWGETLLAAARRGLERETGWLNKRLIR